MKIIAGVDEVGRGSLIGPFYASAVILKKSINQKLLKDSKSLSKKEREYLCKYIKKNSTWSIGKASVKEIEKLNILQASLLAMKRAIKKLKKKPTHVLIDGNKTPELENYNLKSVIKGDKKIPSISAASIIAKVSRDKFITTLSKKNKGYKNIYHLQGGILQYLEDISEEENLFEGECFVFDKRVALDHELEKGSYSICHACGMPVSIQDQKRKEYR